MERKKRIGRFQVPKVLPSLIMATPNHWDILLAVARVPYSTHKMVCERLPHRSPLNVNVRLRHFTYHGYLERFQRDESNWGEPLKYTITPLGIAKLAEYGLAPTVLTTDPEQVEGQRKRQHTHTMSVSATVGSYEAGAKERFIPRSLIMPKLLPLPFDISFTYPNGAADSKKGTITPDEVFGIKYDDRNRYFALETENASPRLRNNLNGSSLHKKLLAYQHIIKNETHKRLYGVDNLRVIITAASMKRLQARIDLALDTLGPSNVFLFVVVPLNGTVDLFSTPCLRAGLPPIRLDTNEEVLE